jgi:hypothetical protein
MQLKRSVHAVDFLPQALEAPAFIDGDAKATGPRAQFV